MSVSNNTVSGNSPSISDNEIEIPTLPIIPPENNDSLNVLHQLYNAIDTWYSDYQATKQVANNYIVNRDEVVEQRILEEKESVSANNVLETEYHEKIIETLSDMKETLETSVSGNKVSEDSVSNNSISCNAVLEVDTTELETYMQLNSDSMMEITEKMDGIQNTVVVGVVGIGLVVGVIVGYIFMRWFK